MQLVISDCDTQAKKHRYVYKCKGKCNYEEEVLVNCPGMHEGILDPQLIVVSPETESGFMMAAFPKGRAALFVLLVHYLPAGLHNPGFSAIM